MSDGTINGLDLEGVCALEVENGELRERAEVAERALVQISKRLCQALNRIPSNGDDWEWRLHAEADLSAVQATLRRQGILI